MNPAVGVSPDDKLLIGVFVPSQDSPLDRDEKKTKDVSVLEQIQIAASAKIELDSSFIEAVENLLGSTKSSDLIVSVVGNDTIKRILNSSTDVDYMSAHVRFLGDSIESKPFSIPIKGGVFDEWSEYLRTGGFTEACTCMLMNQVWMRLLRRIINRWATHVSIEMDDKYMTTINAIMSFAKKFSSPECSLSIERIADVIRKNRNAPEGGERLEEVQRGIDASDMPDELKKVLGKQVESTDFLNASYEKSINERQLMENKLFKIMEGTLDECQLHELSTHAFSDRTYNSLSNSFFKAQQMNKQDLKLFLPTLQMLFHMESLKELHIALHSINTSMMRMIHVARQVAIKVTPLITIKELTDVEIDNRIKLMDFDDPMTVIFDIKKTLRPFDYKDDILPTLQRFTSSDTRIRIEMIKGFVNDARSFSKVTPRESEDEAPPPVVYNSITGKLKLLGQKDEDDEERNRNFKPIIMPAEIKKGCKGNKGALLSMGETTKDAAVATADVTAKAAVATGAAIGSAASATATGAKILGSAAVDGAKGLGGLISKGLTALKKSNPSHPENKKKNETGGGAPAGDKNGGSGGALVDGVPVVSVGTPVPGVDKDTDASGTLINMGKQVTSNMSGVGGMAARALVNKVGKQVGGTNNKSTSTIPQGGKGPEDDDSKDNKDGNGPLSRPYQAIMIQHSTKEFLRIVDDIRSSYIELGTTVQKVRSMLIKTSYPDIQIYSNIIDEFADFSKSIQKLIDEYLKIDPISKLQAPFDGQPGKPEHTFRASNRNYNPPIIRTLRVQIKVHNIFYLYILKIIRCLFQLGALYLAEKIFVEHYMNDVHLNNLKDPESLNDIPMPSPKAKLTTLIWLFLAIDAAAQVIFTVSLIVLSYTYARVNTTFILDNNMLIEYIRDSTISDIVFTLVAFIIAKRVMIRKYFEYPTKGITATKAYTKMLNRICIVNNAIPYTMIFR
jgi:hypothetical protein